MPRIKSNSFQGSPLRDCVPTGSIFSRLFKRAIGETASVYDKLTGSNGETATINHSGNGRGCPINPVIVNNYIGRRINFVGNASYSGEWNCVACPVFIPRNNESSPVYIRAFFELTQTSANDSTPSVVICNSSGTVVFNSSMYAETVVRSSANSTDQKVAYKSKSIQLDYGLHFVFIRINVDIGSNQNRIVSWQMAYESVYHDSSSTISTTTNEETSAAHSILSPANWVDFYDQHIPENGGLDSYVLTRLNRNQGALWEYLTGARIDGNSAYQCSTTRNHDSLGYANEPLLSFPLCSQATSMIYYSASIAKPPANSMTGSATEGFLDHACWPTAQPSTASPATFNRNTLYFPSFAPIANKARFTVLLANTDNSTSLSNWRTRIRVNGLGSAFASPVQLFDQYYVATSDQIEFSQDTYNHCEMQIAHTSAGALSQPCVICGYAIYFID